MSAGVIDQEYLDSIRTPRGGYLKADLAELGVPWPPPKGWKEKLLRESFAALPEEWGFMPDSDRLRCNVCYTYTTIGEARRPDGPSACGACGSTDLELM